MGVKKAAVPGDGLPLTRINTGRRHLPHGAGQGRSAAMSEPDTRAYGYFDHDADVGVIGRGQDIERAFENAAVATFALMASR